MMKQIRFWGQPQGKTEILTTLTDDVWNLIRERLDNGEKINTIYQELIEDYNFEVGETHLYGIYEVFDFEVGDCDCEDSKRSVIKKNEE